MVVPLATVAVLTAGPAARERLSAPQAAATKAPVDWPSDTWPVATPESQGLSAAAFAALDQEIRDGVYGNVDRIFVTRNGHAIVNHRYARDYATISRGRMGPLGCGDGCADKSWMHGNGAMGQWGNAAMGQWGNGAMGQWGNGAMKDVVSHN